MILSRLLSIFFMAVCSVGLVACSGGTPASAVKAFYSAAAQGDVEETVELVSFSNLPAAQIIVAKSKVQIIVGEIQSRIQANEGLEGVEILESSLSDDGKRATLRVRLEFKNGKDKIESHRLAKEDGEWKILIN